MKTLCRYKHHHDSSTVDWNGLVVSEADALDQAMFEEHSLYLDAKAALEGAEKAGEDGFVVEAHLEDEEDDPTNVVVWKIDGVLGVCVADSMEDIEKRESVWLHFEDWEPGTEERARVEAMSKEELVAIVLELEAVRN